MVPVRRRKHVSKGRGCAGCPGQQAPTASYVSACRDLTALYVVAHEGQDDCLASEGLPCTPDRCAEFPTWHLAVISCRCCVPPVPTACATSAVLTVLQVRRTKEMLSANTAAPLSVEELYDGRDFQVGLEAREGRGSVSKVACLQPLRPFRGPRGAS